MALVTVDKLYAGRYMARSRTLDSRAMCSVALLLGATVIAGCFRVRSDEMPKTPQVVRYGYEVVNVYPHDREAFTQGLIVRDGFLFESTGLIGQSTLRKVRLETGEVLQQVHIDVPHFAEGLTDWRESLVQLTWQSNVGFVYELSSFALKRRFTYAGEGWGLTRDSSRLIVSDGSAILRFLDPDTFNEIGRVRVVEDGLPVEKLNELEFVNGEVFANVFETDEIVSISPATGAVTGRVDLRGLLSPADRASGVDVLNGIAYEAQRDRLFVTGKLWPRLFEIRLRLRE